ncbi:hypothetical protein [Streptomyces sp. NPDC001165]|uniref:hypothetical protein n=1 Tax=Streptomyces sp. NPDC001165 TaxID=3364546 RepID=UPI003676252A
MALADHPGPLTLPDRPTTDDFDPLPHNLTLDNAVAVRAHQVRPGDLLVAEFTDGPVQHIPGPYPADPHPLSIPRQFAISEALIRRNPRAEVRNGQPGTSGSRIPGCSLRSTA